MTWVGVAILALVVVIFLAQIVWDSFWSILDQINEVILDKAEGRAKEAGKKLWQTDQANWEAQFEQFSRVQENREIGEKAKSDQEFASALSRWEDRVRAINASYEAEKQSLLKVWREEKAQRKNDYERELLKAENFKSRYDEAQPDAISNYNQMLIEQNHLEYGFPIEVQTEYASETKTLVVESKLPPIDAIPTLKEVKYIKSRNSLKKFHLKQPDINKLYDNVIYQLCLADINIILTSDEIEKIEAVAYNGWVQSIDKSTGNEVNACILSLHVTKSEFLSINLDKVDAKECFRHLKGVGSSKLHSITPIAPIMKINTNDSRFVDAYDVAHTLNEQVNLAAMDWQDFEHLVREVLQKRLSGEGMEVKVTQSSRDRGVDAIAINPDPVVGGKIVIQAKRYTNTVEVAAVRDLYGTLMNEGAMKGILVTTSNFGHDAYEFAKGKPLTLISGGELLKLLSDIGYNAKIDIREAKRHLSGS